MFVSFIFMFYFHYKSPECSLNHLKQVTSKQVNFICNLQGTQVCINHINTHLAVHLEQNADWSAQTVSAGCHLQMLYQPSAVKANVSNGVQGTQ